MALRITLCPSSHPILLALPVTLPSPSESASFMFFRFCFPPESRPHNPHADPSPQGTDLGWMESSRAGLFLVQLSSHYNPSLSFLPLHPRQPPHPGSVS